LESEDSHIEVISADITTLKVDAIVNAANRELAGGGGVDGAIHAAAGPKLLQACNGIGSCETGKAVCTSAFDLPCQFVIHTVGPIWQGGQAGESEQLEDCYRNSMQIASKLQLRSIAFSAISCGVYGFPTEQAAEIAVNAIWEELPECYDLSKVYLVCFDEEVERAYRAALQRS
jgi:O-acetyl-ADP-ribose deacetylase (regulator of RNase III)